MNVRRLVGIAFVIAGLPKFFAYDWELDAFQRFGLPAAPVWVIAAGIIEIVGGICLLRNRFVVPSTALLAMTMVVAIGVSGVKEGDVIPSLTVAPLLLAGCLHVIWTRCRTAPSGDAASPVA